MGRFLFPPPSSPYKVCLCVYHIYSWVGWLWLGMCVHIERLHTYNDAAFLKDAPQGFVAHWIAFAYHRDISFLYDVPQEFAHPEKPDTIDKSAVRKDAEIPPKKVRHLICLLRLFICIVHLFICLWFLCICLFIECVFDNFFLFILMFYFLYSQ